MAKTFYITTKSSSIIALTANEGDAQTIRLDATAWAEDNATITSATWSVASGSATVSASLTSNVSTALITTTDIGASLLKCIITDGTRSKVIFAKVKASKPFVGIVDYGLCA